MGNKQVESIIESMFTIVPMLKKDFMKPESGGEIDYLSPSHYHILFFLEDVGIQPMTEIGKFLQVNKSNLTPLIQKLFDKQLVERIPDEKDRRYIRIGLTSAGVELLENHKKKMAEHLIKKLSVLNPEELVRLSESLLDVKLLLSKLF